MQDACRRCCGHCLNDLPCALTYKLCDDTRRKELTEPYQPWWPASIDSPTAYFQLKRRSLGHQLREQARLRSCSDPSVWRGPHTSTAAGAGSVLLARRGQRQLSVRLPVGRTNLSAADELEFVGVRGLALQAAAQQHQHAPAAVFQPARLAPALPLPQNSQQPQQHTPPRPEPLRLAPLPCVAPCQGLLATLALREQCHPQELASAGWGGAFHAVEANAAALQLLQWHGHGQDASAHAYQQQQQQADAAAAAAAAGAWPYSIPQQQHGCWAFASSLAGQPTYQQCGAASALAAC